MLRQLRIVRHHNDQAIARHFLEQLHDLHARFAVQRACRLVRQHNVRIVHQRAGDRHTLHLPAGKLVRPLVDVLRQPHPLQRFFGAAAALPLRHPADRQRQLHIRQHTLVRDQVVALEHKPDRVIAIRVPIAIAIFFRGRSIDDQIAVLVAVQPANDIEQRRLTRTTRPQDRHKLVVTQIKRDPVQSNLREIARRVGLADISQLQHCASSSAMMI